MTSTVSKLIHLPTERRRRNYRPPDPLKMDLLKSHVEVSLRDVSRLCWEDPAVAAKLTEALTVGNDAC